MDCVWRAVKKLADTAESWTCRRLSDGMFVQIDFILSDVRISVESNWNDFMISLGIDHRCVHCRLALRTRRRRKQLQQHGMKHWKPHMDEEGQPSMFHEAVTKSMAGRTMRNFNDFENVLVSAGRAGGTCVRKRHKFKESRELHTLRLDRRCARTVEDRKRLTFLIQLRHKQELRAWKTWKVNAILPCKTSWKHLPGIQAASHRTVSQQPEPNEFADMLEELFAGDPGGDLLPTQFTEIAWEKGEVYKAIKRMKVQKSADECGLVAEILKHVPDSFIDTLVGQFNDLMRTGQVPTDWRKTSFKMLPKTIRAKVPSEYCPIATIRLFYKLFAYMILGRVETQLETHQPEEQHGFRGGRRVEEHLVTTRLVLDKLSNADVPIWIVSLDLSKAFDRVHWPALWLALSEQGLSEHMIWMIQNLYRDQQGQVVGSNGCSRSFAIHGGVRQGCVLSPRLFCSVLEMSMANWRDEMEHLGLDLCDGGRSLLDLRFADDILIFGPNYHVIGVLLDKLVENLAAVGLQLNTQKTKVLTTQAQPPSQLQTPNGLIISVLDRESSHKWLGCMLTTAPVQTTTCDVECGLQAAARAFNANRWILCDPKVSIAQKLEYFDRVISPIACFAAGHRTIYRNDLRSMDVAYRRLLRSVVGPPRNMDWALPWHEILHIWNERVRAFTSQTGSKSWSEICLRHHWNLAQYFATLPEHRWIKRVLAWQPQGHRRSGRPKYSWDTLITNFCRWKNLPSWEVSAIDVELWRSNLAEFLEFCKC